MDQLEMLWNHQSETLEGAALAWWATSHKCGTPGAVKWLSNDQTGSLVIVTRGEYADDLKAFIQTVVGGDLSFAQLIEQNRWLRQTLETLTETMRKQADVCQLALDATK